MTVHKGGQSVVVKEKGPAANLSGLNIEYFQEFLDYVVLNCLSLK
jgi:hypothetical protein